MDEQTLEKNDVLQELLKSEYDLAKHECEYYTQEFNKQDTVYGVYFAVFSVVIGAIYKIAETNNDQLELTNLAVRITTLIISKKPGNTGISRDIRTEFTTDLLLSD